MQPSCNHHTTTPAPVRCFADTYGVCDGAAPALVCPCPRRHPLRHEGRTSALTLIDGRGKYQNRSDIRGMRILLTTSDPIFLLPPTHPSRSCGSTAHARAWSWAGLRLVRAARGFDGVGVGVKSPQRHSSLSSQGKCHETISMCHGAPRETRQRTRARVARTLAARRRCRLLCSPKGKTCGNKHNTPPLRGP